MNIFFAAYGTIQEAPMKTRFILTSAGATLCFLAGLASQGYAQEQKPNYSESSITKQAPQLGLEKVEPFQDKRLSWGCKNMYNRCLVKLHRFRQYKTVAMISTNYGQQSSP
jgi:hypothetical protein